MTHGGKFFATGYSGNADGYNNPDKEAVKMIGPIPKEVYKIAGHGKSKGEWTIILIPEKEVYGRTDFRIYGDNPATLGKSSQGCIIINGRHLRREIGTSIDNVLEVK